VGRATRSPTLPVFVAGVAVAVAEFAVPVRPVAAVLKLLAMLPAADVAASTSELISERTDEYADGSVNAEAALSTSSLTLESTEAKSVLVLTNAEASERSELRSCALTAVLVRDSAVRRYVRRMFAGFSGEIEEESACCNL
jgi:hypothetical protein